MIPDPAFSYIIEIYRTPQGHLKVQFVEYHHQGHAPPHRRVQYELSMDCCKSKTQLEAWCHLWALNGTVPRDAYEASS